MGAIHLPISNMHTMLIQSNVRMHACACACAWIVILLMLTEADDNSTWCTVRVAADRVLPTCKQGVQFWFKKTRDGRWINMTILFSAIPKDILIYLDQMNIYLFKPVELKTWYARVRKYARYGETSHDREVKICPEWRKFFSTPENTLILKDSVKIDPFRPKRVKTRYVRAST